MPGISIIICTYNAAKRVQPTLQHLQKQEFDTPIDWEVILVDNASTDNTAQTAEHIWNQNPVTRFSVVNEEKPGLMNARYKGLEHARYDIISFIDDDNWVEKRWVQKVVDVFAMKEKIGACGGRSEAVFENISPQWFTQFENSFAVGKQAEESGIIDEKKGFLWGAGLSFRKSLWYELQKRKHINLTLDRKGTTLSSGGDTELCYAFRLMGYQLYYKDDLLLKHYMPHSRMSFSYLEKMCVGFGKSFPLLNCYRALLYPETFKLHSWFYEWMAAQKKIIQLRVKLSFAIADKTKWQLKTEIAYWKGYASEVWQTKDTIQENISTLKSVFKQEA